MTRILPLTLLAGAWLAVASLTAQPTPAASAQFWSDPAFVARFLGSYGVLSEREPKITAEEQKLFTALIPLVRTDKPSAVALLQRSIVAESSAALDFTLANLQLELGNFDAAVAAYSAAIRKFPDFLRAHKNVGLAYVQKGKLDEAITAYTRALELGGEDGNVYGVLGYCHLVKENYFSAEAAYRKALLFAPASLDWKLGIARCLLAQQEYHQAASLFEELIQQHPDNVDYWLHQANAFLGRGEPLRAARNYEIVRRMGKADARVLNNLGDIYLSQDLLDLASESYLASLTTDPRQDIARPLRQAEMLSGRGAQELANGLLDRIQSDYRENMSDENKLRFTRQRAKVAMALNQDQLAVASLEELIRQDPLDGEALILLGGFYGRNHEGEKAELFFERAAQIKQHEVNALIEHAKYLVGQSQYDKAARLLQQAQAIRPRENVARYLDQVERLARVYRP
ncbi:MAG: tetratricopeptide repeat protein [Verrucomicrobia bacterium]|nr:tetratricopeptide repeat protein [Verrucomicrobiota bacterium]